MKYISHIDALNYHLPDDETCGDWHALSLPSECRIFDTADSVFGDSMLREGVTVNVSGIECGVATHVRAVLDMLASGAGDELVGFSDDWLCSADADDAVMRGATRLRALPNWPAVDRALSREYGAQWFSVLNAYDASEPADREVVQCAS